MFVRQRPAPAAPPRGQPRPNSHRQWYGAVVATSQFRWGWGWGGGGGWGKGGGWAGGGSGAPAGAKVKVFGAR